MQHTGTLPLETGRLLLRRFTVQDAPAMYQNWASDPEVCRHLTWPCHTDAGLTRRLLEHWVAAYADPACYQWAIAPKATPQNPIGSISLVRLDDPVCSGELGYCIGRAWWHQGIASEALAAVLRYLFLQAGFLRLEARHDVANPRSGMVMRRCGMQYEGTLRQAGRNNRGIVDTAVYSILASEYQA